jgi:hypothetical protein
MQNLIREDPFPSPLEWKLIFAASGDRFWLSLDARTSLHVCLHARENECCVRPECDYDELKLAPCRACRRPFCVQTTF